MVLTYANISEKVAVCVFVVTYQTALVQCVYVIIQAVIQQRPCCQTCRVRCFYSPSNLNTVLFRRDVQLILTFKSWSDANFVPLFYNTVSRLVSHVFRWHACEYIGKQAILNAGHYDMVHMTRSRRRRVSFALLQVSPKKSSDIQISQLTSY